MYTCKQNIYTYKLEICLLSYEVNAGIVQLSPHKTVLGNRNCIVSEEKKQRKTPMLVVKGGNHNFSLCLLTFTFVKISSISGRSPGFVFGDQDTFRGETVLARKVGRSGRLAADLYLSL